MKYFISSKQGPMIRSLGLTDSDAKYINIIDSLVAEMDEDEVKSLEAQGFLVEPDEKYFIPEPIFAPHMQGLFYFASDELNPEIPGNMKQMETTGVTKLRDLGYFGSPDVHIGIADSGVDGKHVDLIDNLVGFKDFVDVGNTIPIDPCGHGCIAPYDKIYTSKYGIQNIESFFNNVEGLPVDDDKSEIKNISDLNINTISYDLNNRTTTVNKIMAVHKLFYEGVIYKIKTQTGELTLTPWHPIYISKNKAKRKIIKQKAENLQIGDLVVLARENDSELNILPQKVILTSRYICKYCGYQSRGGKSPQCTNCHKCKWYDEITETYIEIDEKLAFFCGLIFSDGHISKNKQRVSFFSNDINLIKIYEDLALELFGVKCKREIDKRFPTCIKSNFFSVDVIQSLISIGILAGNKSRICRFPNKIAISNKNIIYSFVAGVIEGDGSVDKKNGRIRICSGSKDFAVELVDIMRFLGIKSSVHEFYSRGGFKNPTTKPSYHIRIQSNSDIVSKLVIKNRDVYLKNRKRKFSSIVSIEKVNYSGYMYDLTIENSPVYIANSMVVSNTACASISIGKGIGVEKFHGVAPNTKFSMARVMNSAGQGNESDILLGVDWLVEQGVSIINLSLGSWSTRYTPFSRAVDNVVAKGIAVFVAAGNDGPNQITSPANALNAITCASCNKDGDYSNFSSLGPAIGPDSLSFDKPDIMAWGEDVALARSSGTAMGHVINDQYVYASGTSFATPFMAGCGALLKSLVPDMTPEIMKSLLLSTAYNNGKYDEYHEGFGNVRIFEAVNQILNGKLTPETPAIEPSKKGCLGLFF